MIRPFTCVCFLLACGSGLYLYQAKHRVQVLDRKIEQTVHATDELREQSRVLHAEWTLQNDPQRLQTLADQFLTLKTVTPGQFTSMADLDSRLPAVPPPPPPPAAPTEAQSTPVAQAAPPEGLPAAQPPVVPAAAPPPPVKPAPLVAAVAAPPRPPEHRPQPRPVLAEVQAVRPPPAAIHSVARSILPQPVSPVSAPFVGSALGMARSAPVPPQPMPVSATQWAPAPGGGGG